MKKLTEQDGKSLDMVSENLEALKAIFPEAFTEDLSASGDGQAGGVTFPTINRWEDGLSKPSNLARAQLDAFCERMQKEGFLVLPPEQDSI
jgi:hypothetical protein